MSTKKLLTRRVGFATGAKLAFAAPAIVAGLRGGVAFADSGSRTRGGKDTRSTKAASKASVSDTVTTNKITTTNTTTTVAGEHSEFSVLGRARLCELVGGTAEHRTVGQLRLLRGTTGSTTVTHLAIRLRGLDNKSVAVTGALSQSSLELRKGRAIITGVTDTQVAQLLVANSKDFKSGFQVTVGTRIFVVCPAKS